MMKVKLWRLPVCFLWMMFSCHFVYAADAILSHSPVETDAIAQEVLVYVNQYRASRGLPSLKMSQTAQREAIRHSQDMATHRVPFGHDGFSQRVEHLYHAIDTASGGAENVAYNYNTARKVVDGWIHSPGHLKNMVGRYQLTGIGVVRDKNGKLYYTQLFVRTDKQRASRARALIQRTPVRRGFYIG